MTELQAEIILDTHVLNHTIRLDQDIAKDKRVAVITQICGQWSSIGVTDYDEKSATATHYAPIRIREIKIAVIEKMIIDPTGGSARVIEGVGQLSGVGTRVGA